MKKVLGFCYPVFGSFAMAALVLWFVSHLTACTKQQQQQAVQAVAGPVCAVETALSLPFGSAVAKLTGAADPVACGQALLASLGDGNFCAIPVPASAPSVVSAHVGAAPYKTFGDIPASAFNTASKPQVGGPLLGIVGQFACPVAGGMVVTRAVSGLPQACQGPNAVTATQAYQALIAGCETLFASVGP